MMFTKIGALVILILCFLVGQSIQQECVPQGVVDLRVIPDHYLSWNITLDELCDIDEFLVYIFHPDQPAEYAFSVKETYADVSFLEICEEWVFVVVPISGHTNGAQRRIVDKLPLPRTADLSVTNLNVTYNPDTGMTLLHWELNNTQLGNCSLQYRLTIKETDYIVSDIDWYWNGALLSYLSPCVTYQVSVKAINTADTTIEGPVTTKTSAIPGKAQRAPVLLASSAKSTTANMSFGLESEVRNPCPLIYLDIELHGTGSTISYSIDIGNVDRGSPVNVTVEDLKPDTGYFVTVSVTNTAGRSKSNEFYVKTHPNVDIDPNLPLMKKKEE